MADLLILGSRDNVADTLGMGQFLALRTSCSAQARPVADETPSIHASPPKRARRADAALLVLVRPGQDTLVVAALEAGAHSCLRLPIHAQQVATMLAHAWFPTPIAEELQAESWRGPRGSGRTV